MLKLLRPAVTRVLTPLGRALARHGISPNAVTAAGTLGTVAAALFFYPRGQLFAGTVVITFFVLADLLDGVMARMSGTGSTWGAFLDSTLDRLGDAGIFSGLAIWLVVSGQRTLAGIALFCLVAGALVSYVKARAEGLGMTCDVGLAERPERLVVGLVSAGLAGLGVPYILAVGLWLLAAASAITVGQRLLHVYRQAVSAPSRPLRSSGER
ncbi:CDP-diacylglycerol--glycerol-3-phosphate 3-phosphatidyltransferase [Streptosporangium becharense]|uniref:Phosphatidylinositol phosphate synthase n=1 Tax=Streptosporangium becharense TaxID=1816182 RepID=A0A7W9IC94_9ACTN|nr:CDP-alcohol phosphatidyltransferase family protein [Streptosporangium becharense]MBB2915009.1 CDP-diacylglycerol--glycerol-3-phosphate 3-phosphatidyltransferase [Streptosporangium becharense]MBB5818058.1 CDP-diacylglycerol--glycerol-3-phosphate 3-phosphatidyltransferase [Streptosporangium becharense]